MFLVSFFISSVDSAHYVRLMNMAVKSNPFITLLALTVFCFLTSVKTITTIITVIRILSILCLWFIYFCVVILIGTYP